MKITSLAYSRSEDDPKHRKNPDAVRPAPSPLGLAALSVGGGGSSGSSSSGITVGTTTVTSGTSGRVLYTTSGNVVGSAPINVNALNSTYLDVASAASGSGLTLSVAGGGSNENLTFAAKGTTGDINITYGSALYLKRTVAGANSLNWLTSGGAIKGQWGLAETASTGVIGTAAGDLFFRAQGGAFWFSVDSGVTGAAVLDNNGRLIIGTGGTADAQLSVYSQSTTRPGLKLRALSGTSAGQNVLESYDAAGTTTFSITADGSATISTATIGTANMLAVQTNSIQRLSGGVANIYTSAGANTISIGGNTTPIAIGGNAVLYGDAANVLSLQNSTNAQTFRVYNTYTDASNYERNTINWSSNVCYQRNQNAGTGSARLYIPVTGATTVAGLPTAATAGAGARAFVTDANATTFLSTVAGGGANNVPVVSDGTNWLIG